MTPASSLARRLPLDARRIDAAECIASVLLAIVLARLTGATHLSWAAFSGYMVMRGHVSETLLRGALRVVGTCAGGALALGLTPATRVGPGAAAALLALVTLPTFYAALTARRAYAWLFVSLTFAMVVLDDAVQPGATLEALVKTRVLEVVVGTLACVAVSLVSTYTLRRIWPAATAAGANTPGWDPAAFRHAAQGALAVALLPLVAVPFHVPEIAQGAVTILAVMMMPTRAIGASGLLPVSQRLAQRFLGCVVGGVFSAAALFACHASPAAMLAAVALGVGAGRMVENGNPKRSYFGTQFVLALLVTLVPDKGAGDVTSAAARLLGIVTGLAVLEPVLIAWHLIAPRKGPAAMPPAAAPGEAGRD